MFSRPARPVLVATLTAFVLATLGGVLVDRWLATVQRVAARESVREGITPYADAVAAALSHRVTQITTLRTFVETAEGRAQMERRFVPFSDGLIGSAAGLRAVEIVRDGRIAMVNPLRGNEAALTITFLEHPNEALRRGYRRALSRDTVTMVGPVTLAQGGAGLLLFLRVRANYDASIELVELVIDLPSLVRTFRLDEPPEGLALQLRDRAGAVIAASHDTLSADPVRVVIAGADGDWELRGAPIGGWDRMIARSVQPIRLAIVLIVLLVTVVTYQLVGRNLHLTRLVTARTASLQQLTEEQQGIIERQQATERALASSEERLRLALAASRTATYELDVTTGEMRWSEGVGPMVGRPAGTQPDTFEEALTYVEPAHRPRILGAFDTSSSGANSGAVEVPALREDGGVTWLGLTWASRPDADGEVRRIVGTMTDISERKRLEEQFLHAQKMQAMGTLAGGVAHDFNNLLTVIIGASHMARQSAAVPEKHAQLLADLDSVLSAAQRAAVLTGQLLAFSRRQVMQPARLDVRDLVLGMEGILRRLVGEGIRMELASDSGAYPVFADQGQLTQVVMNLAINARDAMPKGGTLRISVRAGGRPPDPPMPDEALAGERFAILSVADTGTGIAPAVLPKVFEPFFTTKPVGQGTGLGLATVYGIVTQLGGAVRVSSQLGSGSVFDVYLPIDDHAPPERPITPSAGTRTVGSGRTILLAEDEPGVRQLAARVLRNAGYRLIQAEDGTAALEASRAFEGVIDLLLSDVAMPGMSGFDLAATLLTERPNMRVLMMSGYPQRATEETAVLLDDVPFLAKPFGPRELLDAAARALD
ncbi:MAG: response regulator [Gemmatimonadaceae bacterium]|nr:response regulator [Gemmatimonadaceae bacterium]